MEWRAESGLPLPCSRTAAFTGLLVANYAGAAQTQLRPVISCCPAVDKTV